MLRGRACSDSLSGVFRNKLECWPHANLCKYGRSITYNSTFTHPNKSYIKSQTRVEMVESKLVRSVKDFFSFNKLLYASYLPTSGRTEDNHCLDRVFNFKLGCFVLMSVLHGLHRLAHIQSCNTVNWNKIILFCLY